MRRVPSDWTDGVNRTETVKARWTQEVISLPARREAVLSLRGVRFSNQELLGFLPDRTLESIKSMRKRADYRALVQEHIPRINREAEASMTVGTQPAKVEEDCEHALLEYFRALGPPTVYEFRAASLHEICAHVGKEERETTLERLTAYQSLSPDVNNIGWITGEPKSFGEGTRGDITINLWKAPGLPQAFPKKLWLPSGKP